ncbi:TetR/AcrR family transcriptional regulator [Pontibaca salina]|uniref:TetR/AcrR family transcriptional regulator n=1 Tax=Pontibaca salina TaxID=2795731 RepID=A0A934HJA5_9RHOB|nr:TetR/AcrR family transcriptional regulator [Pontibaca salina]MBI6629209.1 TetR/AcrR family transcriptional regulator [Pontibaca salina]
MAKSSTDTQTTPQRQRSLATHQRLLMAAMREFAQYGYDGARVDRICKSAKTNIRMLYHYFGGKEPLYLEVLEETYRGIRNLEQRLEVAKLPPEDGIRELISMTFDHLTKDPYFVRLMMNENLMMARIARKSKIIQELTGPLMTALAQMLKEGQRTGIFRREISPPDLYITILGQCFVHVSNRYTLSHMLGIDLTEAEWLRQRKITVTDLIMTYLMSDKPSQLPISTV